MFRGELASRAYRAACALSLACAGCAAGASGSGVAAPTAATQPSSDATSAPGTAGESAPNDARAAGGSAELAVMNGAPATPGKTTAGANPTAAGGNPDDAPPPDPHRFDWCAARRAKETSPNVSYFFPEKLAQVDTYSVGAVMPTNGRMVVFSGQIPIDDQYAVQGATLTEQLYTSLKNLCVAMEDAGVTTADVFHVGVTYVHKDKSDPFVLAEELRDFFGREQPPTATMMSVPVLINEQMRVQIEATAYLPGNARPRKTVANARHSK